MDRADYLGDPDYNPIPVSQMTAMKYADAWRASIDHERGDGFDCPGPARRIFAARAEDARPAAA
jgi:gamma-glutamyltranspeptidase